VADPSAFAGLEPAQLHLLKAQYLASVQVLDQTEAALKAQLDQVAKARKQVEALMDELDGQLAGEAKPEARTTSARKPKPATRRRPVNR
jgi:cell division protein FtsB